MAEKDWKDLLNNLIPKTDNPLQEKPSEKDITSNEDNFAHHRQDLIIRFERRNGKPATIISNYQGTEQELKELARQLKTHCGTGGSAKDDEILIQGDVRKKVVEYLRGLGYKVRGNL